MIQKKTFGHSEVSIIARMIVKVIIIACIVKLNVILRVRLQTGLGMKIFQKFLYVIFEVSHKINKSKAKPIQVIIIDD